MQSRNGILCPVDWADGTSLCVLASGSAGNCSVLATARDGVMRLCLIDLGLSPRRTVRLLHGVGLRMDQVDDVILTHLDADHFYPGWLRVLPRHTTLRLHRRHAGAAGLSGLFGPRPEVFEGEFALRDGMVVRSILAAHDVKGVAALRFGAGGAGGSDEWSLGFATDIGRADARLVEHLRGVDVLAIESNYCPRMQEASDRPPFLKQRIMGGSGHLSNQQAVEAIGRIGPRRHVVLLHLSRQCNDPELVAQKHRGAAYELTIASQHEATAWIRIAGAAPSHTRPVVRPGRRRVGAM